MQSHHNTNVSVNSIKNSLELFRELGVKISISELDILAQGWSEFSGTGSGPNKNDNSFVTNSGLMNQARLYGDYMKLFIENSDIIERVSFWGVIDSQSWRSGGLPLLFDPEGMAKPAYYKLVGALE
jgi:endo-1,4-beta-xylanase